jgi:hypothetical protein
MVLQTFGLPYTNLVADLIAHPKLKSIDFRAAANKPPKSPGGLNIEGLASTPEGGLLIGFRNPLVNGRALVIVLKNPAEVLAGKRPALGDPFFLDLDQQGVRSLELRNGSYLILGGPIDSGGRSSLYEWDGVGGKPKLLKVLEGNQFNAEALTFFSDSDEPSIFILSDDGTRLIGGIEAKRLKDASRKEYRAIEMPAQH